MLARVFQDMGQDENEKYSELALHLATEFFFDHASKDVRLLVACCIADVFRIFAPEAPYRDPDHLKVSNLFLHYSISCLIVHRSCFCLNISNNKLNEGLFDRCYLSEIF